MLRTIVFVSIRTAALWGCTTTFTTDALALALGPSEQRILKAVLTALFALLWLSFPLTRLVSRSAALPFMWVGYIWMGTIVLSSVVFGLFDLSRFVADCFRPRFPSMNRGGP